MLILSDSLFMSTSPLPGFLTLLFWVLSLSLRSLVLVVMMKSKDLKAKISHAHSLILSPFSHCTLRDVKTCPSDADSLHDSLTAPTDRNSANRQSIVVPTVLTLHSLSDFFRW